MSDTFKRGQVEWALWRFFSSRRMDAPKVFRTRVKRLLELDRERDLSEQSEVPHAESAFFDDLPEGQGVDTRYTPFNTFCLALGLDLLDAGFKQSEVLFLLRHIRGDLEREFAWIMKCPPSPRQKTPAEERPRCPSFEERGRRWADCRVFAVIEKVELTEIYSGEEDSNGSRPIIMQPVFCHGIEALQKELARMNFDYRKALVMEIAEMATMVADHLSKAPVVKRGRK